jgi:hypothetical protein
MIIDYVQIYFYNFLKLKNKIPIFSLGACAVPNGNTTFPFNLHVLNMTPMFILSQMHSCMDAACLRPDRATIRAPDALTFHPAVLLLSPLVRNFRSEIKSSKYRSITA